MIKQSIYYNIGNLIYLGAQWLISVLLVTWGGFSDAGYYSLAMAIGNIAYMLASYGLRSYQVTDITNQYSDGEYFSSRIIMMLVSLIITTLYCLISGFDKKTIFVVISYLVYKLVEAYSDVVYGVLQKCDNLISNSISLGIKGILNIVFFYLAFYFTKSVIISCLAMAFSSFMVMIGFDFRILSRYTKQWQEIKQSKKDGIQKLLKLGLSVMLCNLSIILFNSIPKLVVERKLSVTLLGLFSSISSPAVIISTFAAGFLMPMMVKISRDYDSHNAKGIFKYISIYYSIVILVSACSALLCNFFGRFCFVLLFGEEIVPYIYLFYYVIIAITFISIVSFNLTMMIAMRKIKVLMVFSILLCIIELFLCETLVVEELLGIVVSMIVSSLVISIFELIYIVLTIKKVDANE